MFYFKLFNSLNNCTNAVVVFHDYATQRSCAIDCPCNSAKLVMQLAMKLSYAAAANSHGSYLSCH